MTPNYSPLPAGCIVAGTEQTPPTMDPDPDAVASLLDEVQLAAAKTAGFPEDLVRHASETRYLHTDIQGKVLFLSGLYATQRFTEWLPDCSRDERFAIEHAFRLYASHDAFTMSFPDAVTPVPVRMADYDTLVMEEPGPLDPGQGRQVSAPWAEAPPQ